MTLTDESLRADIRDKGKKRSGSIVRQDGHPHMCHEHLLGEQNLPYLPCRRPRAVAAAPSVATKIILFTTTFPCTPPPARPSTIAPCHTKVVNPLFPSKKRSIYGPGYGLASDEVGSACITNLSEYHPPVLPHPSPTF